MITTKQRAKLRALANNYDVLIHIGKGGITDAVVNQVENVLFNKELVKCSILQNCDITAKDAAILIAEKTGCEIVQVIGKRFVVYKPNPEEPIIII